MGLRSTRPPRPILPRVGLFADAFDDLGWWVEHDRKVALRIIKLLREVLRWKKGSFSFRGSQGVVSDSGDQQKIGGLLLEAMRLEDESRR